MASLPPISAETFNDKVLTAQATSNAVAARASFERSCAACQKVYYSQNSYDNHLRGHRHRTAAANLAAEGSITDNGSVISSTISLGTPINGARQSKNATPRPSAEAEADHEVKDRVSDAADALNQIKLHGPLDVNAAAGSESQGGINHDTRSTVGQDKTGSPNACLFCSVQSSDLGQNVNHMSRQHGLFIPERLYLVDLEGLICWLWEEINEEPHRCLYCHRSKVSAEAVRDHMRDLGHCKIAFEDEEDMIQVGQFYDFTSTYSDDENEEDGGDDGQTSNQDHQDGWEDDSDVESDELDDEVEFDNTKQAVISKSRAGIDPSTQGFVIDEELYLPSGRIAGHRSLKKYFRQNLHNRQTPTERLETQRRIQDGESTARPDVESHSRSNRGRQMVSRADGGLGMLGVTDAKKREVQAVEKRDTKRAQRAEKQYAWGVQKRGNNQKHFRDPLLQ